MNISQIWDLCLQFEYDEENLVNDLDNFLKQYYHAKILDCACGSGFATIDLIKKGYNITCSDGSEDMIEEFLKKAQQKNVKVKKPLELKWSKLSDTFQNEFDIIMCRGGSIPYACAWNTLRENGIENIEKSLQNFYIALKLGGQLYIDIANDQPEVTNYAPVEVGGKSLEASEIVLIDKKTRKRTWKPTVVLDGKVHTSERYSYYLTDLELRNLLYQVGFTKVEEIFIPSEYYTVFLATK
ncbi:MAG: hypothetical protein COX81_01200 [Candidatus Magasanikbacteria bacterium CG_4_10_14_0_2_um_filter_37_12]|uniref:Methyltransferase domain-containing protein n=1 Tax=Candidatus Magasanikbacteria bacterium CG_4_10_14_0_2_um_filter_37_12 TaxID=1974637 RepID=A0A2M7V8Z1_9BACT|nr:MAG: hypothetical protein COX81_01200 [Candidatus Magasanikbacteria bacterium CG_4_10_14_0_2_um_filter_37_12]